MDARIEVTTQRARLDITTHRARIEISASRPKLVLRRNAAHMEVDRRRPSMRLYRAQTDVFPGIGGLVQAARQVAAAARTEPGGVSRSGSMALPETVKLPAIAELSRLMAAQRGASATSQRSEIRWEPGSIDINWTSGSMDLQWDVSAWADIHVEPGYVEIRMAQYPEVRIRVVYDQKKHKYSGKFVDRYL